MAKNTSEVINRFRKKIPELTEENREDLFSKLSTVCQLSSRDYFHALVAKSPQEKLERLLNVFLKNGEDACEKLVGNLKELSSTFPALIDLFQESAPDVNIRPRAPESKRKEKPLTPPKPPVKPEVRKPPRRRDMIDARSVLKESVNMDDPSNDGSPDDNGILYEILSQLGMLKYRKSKMTVSEILTIGHDSLETIELRSIEDAPWYFLRKLMSLNVNARKAHIEQSESDLFIDFTNLSFESADPDHTGDLHPLDILCVLLHCSDSFLQQEIVTKLSMCQFAVPLLLPSSNSSECTFMLWALRDIVKKWQPHSLEDKNGYKEDNVVNVPMPVFSFVRLGKCSLSKADLLNQILMPPQQHQNVFIHWNMEGGTIPKKLSSGLVEMSWYFPTGQKTSDVFPEPITVMNLHGDISSHWRQFSFLTQISSAVFIFADSISQLEYEQLSRLGDANTKYFFVFQNLEKNDRTLQYMKSLNSALKLDDRHFIVKKNKSDSTLVRHLQKIIMEYVKKPTRLIALENMTDTACELGILVDEYSKECKSAKQSALKITRRIREVAVYKDETMKLQGDLWKQLASTRTEICRMKSQGVKNTQRYREDLEKKRTDLIRQQYKHTLPAGIHAFVDSLSKLNRSERGYFMKWLKFFLDSICRANLSELQEQYKSVSDIKQLNLQLSKSSLGVEHFIRELGQFYDAESHLLKNNEIKNVEQKFQKLPEIAAELLLDGLPLELIDGDTSSIPLEWITNVLSELDKKTGGQSRIRVITVLGVQSTGKSTLLNTMFGLQFPVASGRCTRGAFMTLIKVKEDFQQELGCSFILVLDTEGLRAPELSSLDGCNQRDNELATLVVGLSDFTIINFSMEHAADMKDILQIVVHAFLRMDTIGKKPKYYFLHQNVADISANANCLRDKQKLIDDLDEMTRTAAKMEKKSGITSFSDVLDADHENHSWYVPGLWHGLPPMSSVSTGYSEKVHEFKKHLLHAMKTSPRKAQRLSKFSEWIRSLWEAVQHETFIFNFRNSLVAEAYDQLHVTFNELKWHFSKVMFEWMQETENLIRNQPNSASSAGLINEMYERLQREENSMRETLEKYFESGCENVNLITRYREEFLKSVNSLRKHLEDNLRQRLNEHLQIQRMKAVIQTNQKKFMEVIEKKASKKSQTLKNCENQLNLDEEFEKIWNETFAEIKLIRLNKRNVEQEILLQLRTDMAHSIGAVTMALNEINDLKEYKNKCFTAQPHHFDMSWYNKASSTISSKYPDHRLVQMNRYVNVQLHRYKTHVTGKMNTKEDYHDTYCQELLNMINKELQENAVEKLHISALFELDLKLHVMGKAAPMFQKMHEDFIQENDPRLSLEKLKPQYLTTFKNIFLENDQCKKRAEDFCYSCLKPAIVEYMYKNLGREIVDDILLSEHSKEFSSRMFFQFNLLKNLLEEKDFNQYMIYINDYEMFVKSKLQEHVDDRYGKPGGLKKLHEKIIQKINHVIHNALKDEIVEGSPNVSCFLEMFCEHLQKELVISRNAMNVILFQNNDKVQQFSECIQSSLSKMVDEVLKEMNALEIDYVLSMVTLNPQGELFKRVFGCGKRCPFCKVPCEAGGHDHTEHFAKVHRPQGLAGYKDLSSNVLCNSICSTDVVGNGCFRNSNTNWVPERYKEYRRFYPDWVIQSDPGINASDYWKYIMKEFNGQLSEEFNAMPADIPANWRRITQEQAMRSLKDSFNL